MLADIASYPLKLVGHFHDFLRVLIRIDEFAQLRLNFKRFLQSYAGLEGNQLRKFVSQHIRLALHPSHITHYRLRRHGAEGNDLRYRIFAVQLSYVLYNAVATLNTKIHIEVGHRHPFRIEKALEQQIVFKRV